MDHLTVSSTCSSRMTVPLDSVKPASENDPVTTEHPAGTRDRLLSAARAELADRGSASVSMRAVARRAGLSHAAPGHFFGDRAGLLTAVAADGFRSLTESLDEARTGVPDDRALSALGRAYVDFGLAHPALMDLMFRRDELDADDEELREAQAAAIGRLRSVFADGASDDARALVSWAVAHGLVMLAREGVLGSAAGRTPGQSAAVAEELIAAHASFVG